MKHQTKKHFGQHFLTDLSILTRISQSIPSLRSNRVLEIGPGAGALTEYLVNDETAVTVVEFDRDLIPILQNKFGPKIHLINADILTIQLSQVIKQFQLSPKLTVVGNLPYNISTPLMFHLFSQLDCIDSMVFMVQKEVAQRLCASAGSKQYGRLSVMTSIYVDSEMLFDVPPTAFSPPPKVNSSVIRLIPKKNQQQISNPSLFEKIVKQAFSQRRKTLSNALKGLCGPVQFAQANIDPKVRAENLTAAQFLLLSEKTEEA